MTTTYPQLLVTHETTPSSVHSSYLYEWRKKRATTKDHRCPKWSICKYDDCGCFHEHAKTTLCVRDRRDDCPSCTEIKQ